MAVILVAEIPAKEKVGFVWFVAWSNLVWFLEFESNEFCWKRRITRFCISLFHFFAF